MSRTRIDQIDLIRRLPPDRVIGREPYPWEPAAGGGDVGGVGSGGQTPLLNFAAGTFTRSSDASFRPNSESLVNVGSNIMRRENGLYLCEGPRTNLNSRSHQPSFWSNSINLSAKTDNFTISPLGAFDCGRIVSDGVGNFNFGDLQNADTTAGGSRAASFWYKDNVNTGAHLHSFAAAVSGGTGSGSAGDGALPVSSVWRYYALPTFAVAGTPTTCEFIAYIDPNQSSSPGAASGDDLLVYGVQLEVGTFPSSTILTTGAQTTRAADVLTFATGTYPTRMLDGRWQFTIEPLGTSAEFINVAYWWSFGAAADVNYIRWNGAGTIQVVQGGVVKISKAITWTSRYQRMVLTLDCAAGTLEVQGATTGSGVTAGTAFAWPGSLRLNVGMREDLVGQCFCRISEPYAA